MLRRVSTRATTANAPWISALLASLLLACTVRPQHASTTPDPVQAQAPEPAPTSASDSPEPVPAPQAEAAEPGEPLATGALEIFMGSPEDDVPPELGGVTDTLKNKQYLAGNEKSLHAFHDAIKDVGGGYVGVGSDQAYLLIGWARPELAWLADYDPDVVRIHRVYRAFFLHCETPSEFMDAWTSDGRALAHAALVAAYGEDEADALRRLYSHNRARIFVRLREQNKRMQQAGLTTFLSSQADYDYLRTLFTAGRVRSLLVNLLDDTGLRGVGDAAKALGVPIRVLYLSNAEEYWKRYSDQYRENIAALPFDERSVLLRTLLIWHVNRDYRYNWQWGTDYLAWLATPDVRNVYDIVRDAPEATAEVLNAFQTQGPAGVGP